MKFGLSQPFPCSYLNKQNEQLLVLMPEEANRYQKYGLLIHAGFRRSGTQIYRPHCAACNACESIRIPVDLFRPSKSQKRVLNRNKDLTISISNQDKPEYYPLYESYVNQRHADGSMYPASKEQYSGFIINPWGEGLFIEIHDKNELIGIAVTDYFHDSLSALYTFFKPEEDKRSLGTYAILQQVKLSQSLGCDYLYLGYQIDSSSKMSYKQKFLPHERFSEEKWQLITKKAG
jgi:arginine-tRNA-protein transferase